MCLFHNYLQAVERHIKDNIGLGGLTMNTQLTQKELKTLVEYDKNTGIFKRIKSRSGSYNGKFGYIEKKGYLSSKINGKTYKLHRLAWLYAYGCYPKNQIDHINDIKTDNRISNLQDVSQEINQAKSPIRRDNTSGLIGVNRHKGKYVARIQENGKRIWLAGCDCKIKAAIIREQYIINNNLPHKRNFK